HRHHVVLAVQAKKFLKRTNAYVTQLRYPDNSKAQMNTLLSYASSMNRRPFYFIYSLPDSNPDVMCQRKPKILGAVFTADARRLEEYADGKYGRRVTRDQLLAATNPFYCMFCCPLSQVNNYFDRYFSYPTGTHGESSDKPLPSYVQQLLQRGDDVINIDGSEAPRQFRLIGVYDMRSDS
ncbi:MAG TPA: hypothetical protein PLP98_10395, partial [Plasticicumulans sp.]|nr:hypothetical protein [Plasticicumulans sp.]